MVVEDLFIFSYSEFNLSVCAVGIKNCNNTFEKIDPFRFLIVQREASNILHSQQL
tara:strand:- start:125 stop:289 length:165 start_codon:yes stop_codon:yes gene_type:complete